MTQINGSSFALDVQDVQVAGDRWATADTGGSSSPLVLLHGGGQTRHSWDHSAADLAAGGHEVYTLDARGHGDSAWAPDGNYEIDAFAADLLGAIDALDLTEPVLIGASLGGITSLCVVGENPGVASALVLVDVVVDVEPKGIDRIKKFMSDHVGGFESLDDVADAIAVYNPERKRTRNLDGLRKNVRQRDDGRWYWHWDPAFIASGEEARRHTDPERLGAAARKVTVPTLIVRGGKSDVVSDAGIESMLKLVPHAEVADVSAAGHMVAGDDNQVFADAIKEFLTRNKL
ncbi:alpha/beta fold hydrolase [Gordonia sp. CPCC 205333]|uniref:alpha/beta fold hydrolase n=1 Tax=Gordonia sp. CPCC 205333 TaxID=3140790 RepID=UPI003AF40067